MIAGVADTHAALWYVFGDPNLSTPATSFIDQAASGGRKIALSAISMAKILYLTEKGGLPSSAYTKLRQRSTRLNTLSTKHHLREAS